MDDMLCSIQQFCFKCRAPFDKNTFTILGRSFSVGACARERIWFRLFSYFNNILLFLLVIAFEVNMKRVSF